MRLVILPQAVVRVFYGLLNQLVTCFKSISIVSVIAIPDLMYQAGLIVGETFFDADLHGHCGRLLPVDTGSLGLQRLDI